MLGKAHEQTKEPDKFQLRMGLDHIDCDFRLIRTALVKQLDLTTDSGAICVELITGLAGLGARFEEVPVTHYARRFGRSQFFQIRRIVRTLYQLNQLRSRLREGGRPDEHC